MPEGDYDIQAVVADAEPLMAGTTTELIVTPENASVVFDDNNPIAVGVDEPGDDCVDFYIVVRANETDPDTAITTAAVGDISQANV